MERNMQEALTEVNEILKVTPAELISKIPTEFRELIEKNRAKDYKFQLEEPFNEKDLKQETIVILGLIYRDFFTDPEEREELQLRDAEEIKKVEEEMNKQYDINNIFQKRKEEKMQNVQKSNEEELDLVLYKKQGFLKKFFNLIKGIFAKK